MLGFRERSTPTKRISRGAIPKGAFSAHTEILQYEPDSKHIINVCQLESADTKTADEISSEHAAWLSTGIGVGDAVWRQERALALIITRLLCRRRHGGIRGIVASNLFRHWLR